MTYGEAVNDTSTVLGRMAEQCRKERNERIALAQIVADRDGITLEEAIMRHWNAA